MGVTAWTIVVMLVIALVLFRALWLLAGAASARDLVRLRHTLTSLAETTHDWLWSTDREGRISYSNSGSTLLGYLPEEVMGRLAYELMDQAGLPEWQVRVSDLGRLGLGWSDVTLHMRHRDGHLVDIECSAAPIPGKDGRGEGFEGTARPLSADVALATTRSHQRHRVEQVLKDHAVRIAFQPIVSLSTGAVVGVEALARIDSDPYLAPDVWLRDASDVGLGVTLELQALQAALDSATSLPPGLYISINASPRTIADPAFLELLLSHDTALERLVLEITEHESVPDYAPLTNTLGFAPLAWAAAGGRRRRLWLRVVPAHPHAAPGLHQARPRPHCRHRQRRGAPGPRERRGDVRPRA